MIVIDVGKPSIESFVVHLIKSVSLRDGKRMVVSGFVLPMD
jgi:hypothetical protein